MKGLLLVLASVVAAGGTVIACSGDTHGPTDIIPADLPGCGASSAPFSTLPFDVSNITGWVPLGALNPPGHTFPTDHQYIYLKNFSSGNAPVTLYAPGNVTITGARIVHYNNGAAPDDYALDFTPCRELSVNFGHVRTLAPAILTALGPFDQQCASYSPAPGTTVNNCFTKRVEIKVGAGDIIGTSAGLDLLLFDSRVQPIVYANPSRWIQNETGFDHFHVAPMSDYYSEPARSIVGRLLGSFDGKTHRTVEPLGGSIGSDIAGTVQGTWMNATQPTYPESPHLAIVPDNVDPTRIDVSIGISQPAFDPGAYTFTPSTIGVTNRHPATITPGASIYCWEIGYSASDRRGVVLVQLVDAKTLRVEARAGATRSCGGEGVLAFTASAFTYSR